MSNIMVMIIIMMAMLLLLLLLMMPRVRLATKVAVGYIPVHTYARMVFM